VLATAHANDVGGERAACRGANDDPSSLHRVVLSFPEATGSAARESSAGLVHGLGHEHDVTDGKQRRGADGLYLSLSV
jgi:hypothetical protein